MSCLGQTAGISCFTPVPVPAANIHVAENLCFFQGKTITKSDEPLKLFFFIIVCGGGVSADMFVYHMAAWCP